MHCGGRAVNSIGWALAAEVALHMFEMKAALWRLKGRKDAVGRERMLSIIMRTDGRAQAQFMVVVL